MAAEIPFPAVAATANDDTLLIASGSTLHQFPSDPSSSSSPASCSIHPNTTTKNHLESLIRHVSISSDGRYAATLTDDKYLYTYALNPLKLLSSRQLTKKGQHLSFSPKGDLIITDKVGDVYLYPFAPRNVPEEQRLASGILASDPSKNPDGDLLLGHVSSVPMHVLTPNKNYLVTCDRDEHIRISRFPQSYVIERYLFGSETFVSSLCIPKDRPNILISGGGELSLRIWDWQKGKQVGSVDITGGLKYRKVRSNMRKLRGNRKAANTSVGEDEFLKAPEGWMLPSGKGLCVKQIESVRVGNSTVVLFYSLGCTALHSFVLAEDQSSSPTIHTLPTTNPILSLTTLPSTPNKVLITLDTVFDKLRQNPIPENMRGIKKDVALNETDVKEMAKSVLIAEINESGEISDISSSSALLPPVLTSLSQASLLADQSTLAQIDHYSELSLYPRWPGFEEDDNLAGTSEGQNDTAAPGTPKDTPESGAGEKVWTREEMEKLPPKELGRLKAQGVDVLDILSKKRKAQRGKPAQKKIKTQQEGAQ